MGVGRTQAHLDVGLVAQGAPIDVAGVGTRMGVSADAPSLDSAYKLVEYAGRPVRKLSPGKATLPGRKQVWRRTPIGVDVLGLRDEPHDRGRWLELLAANPILIERPILVTRDGRAALGRPPEAIGALL